MDDGQTMNTPGSGQGTRPDGGKSERFAGELRASESWFRSLLETTSDWLWEIDTKGVFCYASPKVKDLLGYEPDEVIGMRPLDLMPADEAGRMAGTLHEHALNRHPFLRMEHWNQHKTGQLVLIETSGVPLFDEKGVWCNFFAESTGTSQIGEKRSRRSLKAKRNSGQSLRAPTTRYSS